MTAGTRVLIVEDDPQMVRFLRATLTAHEFAVTVAEGVAAGALASPSESVTTSAKVSVAGCVTPGAVSLPPCRCHRPRFRGGERSAVCCLSLLCP